MDYSEKTGQKAMAKAPRYRLKEIALQGQEPRKPEFNPTRGGNFKLTHLDVEKAQNEVYKVEDMGNTVEVVVLKIRRILAQYDKQSKKTLRTTEHNSPNDVVTLFGVDGGPEVGLANELRQKYQGLRTQQIIYVYVPKLKEVCRLVIKGSALGSQERPEDVPNFYQYISSFNDVGEHLHEHITRLTGIEESDYYTVKFEKGQKLEGDKLKKIELLIDRVCERTEEIDKYYSEKQAKVKRESDEYEQVGQEAEEVIEYPVAESENINPDDIPF